MNKPKSPRLRFPNISKDLTANSLNELSLLVTSGSRDWAQFYSISGAKFIRMTNLRRGSPVLDLDLEELKYVCVPKTSRDGFRTKLEHGDVLVSITAELGKIGLVPKDIGDAYINQHVALVRPKKSELCGFLAHYLTAPQTHKRLNRLNDSGAKSGLNLSTLKAFPVYSPETDECRKIADFLTSVDTKINQLTESYRLLKEYKKGVMQQIFSQKVRFKDEDGKAFPEWKEYALKEILLLQSDFLSMDDEETYELITVKRGFGGVKSRGHFKGKDVLVKNQFTIHENEFVISKRQIVHGACGLVPSELDGAIVSNEYNVFRPVEELLDIEYFNRFTTTPFMRRAFFTNSDGVHIEKLLFKTQGWLKTRVHIPCLEEQQKITQFLQAIDVKIKAIAEQIEQTKQFKKGLLQQMFV